MIKIPHRELIKMRASDYGKFKAAHEATGLGVSTVQRALKTGYATKKTMEKLIPFFKEYTKSPFTSVSTESEID